MPGSSLPTIALLPLLITAGVLALVLLWPRVRSGTPAPRLVVEALLVTGGLATLLWGLIEASRRLSW